jgi:hypothetical protein
MLLLTREEGYQKAFALKMEKHQLILHSDGFYWLFKGQFDSPDEIDSKA